MLPGGAEAGCGLLVPVNIFWHQLNMINTQQLNMINTPNSTPTNLARRTQNRALLADPSGPLLTTAPSPSRACPRAAAPRPSW